MGKLLLEEQEVVINFDRVGENATIYTSDMKWIRKLDRMCEAHPDVYKCINESTSDGRVFAKTYSFPKKLVSVRNPMKKRNISEEVRAKMRENLAKCKNKKKNN